MMKTRHLRSGVPERAGRITARFACGVCGKPIVYGEYFYREDGPSGRGIIHAACCVPPQESPDE